MLKVVRCDGFSNSAILVSMKHDKPPCVKPLMLRLPEELHEKIEAAASNEGRSLSNMTRRILERWVAEQQAAA